MEFVITKEKVEGLGQYLITRPWAEANQFILMLQGLKPLEQEDKVMEMMPTDKRLTDEQVKEVINEVNKHKAKKA